MTTRPIPLRAWQVSAALTAHHRNIDIAPRGNPCVASNLEGMQP
jgi:hypothetical protein